MNQSLKDSRIEYRGASLEEAQCPNNPFELFERWFARINKDLVQEPNAIGLATCSTSAFPSLRMVLMKDWNQEQGFLFFTNYESQKGRELESNPRAALLFYWPPVFQQIRIQGDVVRASVSENDRYFSSRPIGSQIAAVVSKQSHKLENRDDLEQAYASLSNSQSDIQRPAYWGGYWLIPSSFEFWQGRENRLHDRIRYQKLDSHWNFERLAP